MYRIIDTSSGKREKERERERSSRMSTLPGEGGSVNARNAPQINGGFGLGSPNFIGFPALSFVSRTLIPIDAGFNRYRSTSLDVARYFLLEMKISVLLKKNASRSGIR